MTVYEHLNNISSGLGDELKAEMKRLTVYKLDDMESVNVDHPEHQDNYIPPPGGNLEQ